MLKARQYKKDIIEARYVLTYSTFIDFFKDRWIFINLKHEKKNKEIYVYISDKIDTFRKDEFIEVSTFILTGIEKRKKEGKPIADINRVCLVVGKDPDKNVRNEVEKFLKAGQEFGIQVEFFNHKEMRYDPTENNLVPQHILLTDEEISQELMKDALFLKKNFPIIRENDRIARHYEGVHGNIFKIIRPTESSGQEISFRVVVHASSGGILSTQTE